MELAALKMTSGGLPWSVKIIKYVWQASASGQGARPSLRLVFKKRKQAQYLLGDQFAPDLV